MNYYRCLRTNPWCKVGQYLANESEGDDFLLCTMQQVEGRNKYKMIIRSGFTVPYHAVAPFVTPLGFRVPISMLREPLHVESDRSAEIKAFQDDVAEIYDEEKLRRDKAANPTHTGRKE